MKACFLLFILSAMGAFSDEISPRQRLPEAWQASIAQAFRDSSLVKDVDKKKLSSLADFLPYAHYVKIGNTDFYLGEVDCGSGAFVYISFIFVSKEDSIHLRDVFCYSTLENADSPQYRLQPSCVEIYHKENELLHAYNLPYACLSSVEYPPDLRAFSSRYGLFRAQADKEVKGYHELLRLILRAINRQELLSEDDVDFEYSLGDIEDELQWANGIISQQDASLAQQRVENKILNLAQSNAFVALTLARAWATWSGASDIFWRVDNVFWSLHMANLFDASAPQERLERFLSLVYGKESLEENVEAWLSAWGKGGG